MAERKSKPKHAPRKVDDEEPTGIKKAFENPVFILGLVIVIIIVLVVGIFALSRFLSGA